MYGQLPWPSRDLATRRAMARWSSDGMAGGLASVQPSYRLDLGPDRHTPYYDKNERLGAAITRDPAGTLTTADLLTRYPALQKGRR